MTPIIWLSVVSASTLSGSEGYSNEILGMVMRSGPVARLVLLILIGFSIISWAIIFQKFRFFRKASKESDRFNELFNENRNMAAVYASSKKLRHSPLARMFLSAYGEISRGHQPSFNDRDELSLGYLERKEELAVDYVQKITRLLNRVSNQEVGRLEKMLGFLATTGSATPFIGLFGTVWGVMNAFQGIGARGSANIATVAPGISEALIATAAGLAAAIPAVIAYNYFVNQIKVLANAMDDFSSRFIDYTEREAAKRFL